MRVAALVLALFFIGPVLAQQPTSNAPKAMDILDFAVDARDLTNKRVTINECEFGGTNQSWVFCRAPGGTGGVSVGVQTRTLPKEDFRRALKECTGYGPIERCKGSVTGIVFESVGPALKNAEIKWTTP